MVIGIEDAKSNVFVLGWIVVPNQQIRHVLVGILVIDIIELDRSIHACILQEDLPAARVLVICDIVDFAVDEQPHRVFRVMLEDLV